MNPQKISLLLSVIISIMTVGSCEIFTDEDTDKICGENVLNIKIDMPVQCLLTLWTNQDYPTAEHKVSKAAELQCTGYIRKIDCNGGENGYYELNYTIFPKEKFTIGVGTYIFNIGPQNKFSFANKRDYISITYKMKLIFDDGRKYESDEIVKNSDRFSYLVGSSTSSEIIVFLDLPAKWNTISI